MNGMDRRRPVSGSMGQEDIPILYFRRLLVRDCKCNDTSGRHMLGLVSLILLVDQCRALNVKGVLDVDCVGEDWALL